MQQQLGMMQQQQQRFASMQQRARSCAPARPVRSGTCLRAQRLAFSSGSSGGSTRRAPVAAAGKLDEVSLFADSSLLGPGKTAAGAAAGPAGVDGVELKSQVRQEFVFPRFC